MLEKYLDKIPGFLKNKYILVLCLYLFYMFFLDSNDYISQWKLRKTYRSLVKQEKYYNEQIKTAKLKYDNLFNNPESLERFAREKYWMKKEGEDLYIIADK